MNKILISIVGPTAIGKTSLSLALAKHFNTEILSADSRQFYQEMKIGTAVPTPDELAVAPHHFIQHKSVEQTYSVGDFERDASKKLEDLFKVHDLLILVGGSGLYVDAVTKGLDEFPHVDPSIREKLNEELKAEGLASLQKKLKNLDQEYYSEVDLENPHRLIRALEVCIGTGKPYSSFRNKNLKKRPFRTISIGLTAEREFIYNRINLRVDLMMDLGLLDEVKFLIPRKEVNALNTVGYKELFAYLEGKMELEEAVSEIKKNTRRFAKRQLTWFRKNKNVRWFDSRTPPEEVISYIEQQINTAQE